MGTWEQSVAPASVPLSVSPLLGTQSFLGSWDMVFLKELKDSSAQRNGCTRLPLSIENNLQ